MNSCGDKLVAGLRWLCIGLLCPFSLCSQSISEYQGNFFSIYQSRVLNTPVPILESERGEFIALYQGRNGVYSDVNAMYFSTAVKWKERHVLGALVVSETEGEFLKKTRYYGNYALRIPLNQRLHLSAGMMAGMVSYQFGASSSGVGGNDLKWDASLGIALSSKRFSIGVNAFQLPQSRVKPLAYDYVLRRYYVLLARFRQAITENCDLLYVAEARAYADRQNQAKLSIAIEIYKNLHLGILTDNLGNSSVYAGGRMFLNDETSVGLHFNYTMLNLWGKGGYRFDIYEISADINF